MFSHITTRWRNERCARRGWIVLCAVGILFSLVPSSYAHEEPRIGIEEKDWENEKVAPLLTEQGKIRVGTALVISGLVLNVVVPAVGLPVVGILANEDINAYTAVAVGVQIAAGAAGGLFGGIIGLTADLTWRNFGFGVMIGGILGVSGGILAYTFAIPPPDGGTAVGLYTAMIQTGFAGLVMWISGAILGGLKDITPHGVASRQPNSIKEQDVYVAFTGSHLVISY